MVLDNDHNPDVGPSQKRFDPRASLVPLLHRADVAAEIWFGGADAASGERLTPGHLSGAWLVDCAGELPAAFRSAADHCFARVFADIETVPAAFGRISSLARGLAVRLSSSRAEPSPHADGIPTHPPSRVYIMCSQGLNRSGLVAGLILRELGVDPDETVALLRAARPGSLSNATFEKLLRG